MPVGIFIVYADVVCHSFIRHLSIRQSASGACQDIFCTGKFGIATIVITTEGYIEAFGDNSSIQIIVANNSKIPIVMIVNAKYFSFLYCGA